MGLMLDVAIGMCAVFLLASLFVTVLQELVAQALALRARYLAVGILNLLEAGKKNVGPMAAIAQLSTNAASSGTAPTASSFYAHPMIAGLSSNRVMKTDKPSYISRETFAAVALDLTKVLQPSSPPAATTSTDVLAVARALKGTTPLETAVRTFAEQVGGDIDKLKERLGNWFDDAMERVAGAYKRWTQIAALLLGLVVAVIVNIDTVQIVRALSNSPQQAAQLADSVTKIVNQYPELKKDNEGEVREKLKEAVKTASLPIGWKNGISLEAIATAFPGSFIGWLLTALAASLGAAFWFDTLKRFVSIRSSGKNPNEK